MSVGRRLFRNLVILVTCTGLLGAAALTGLVSLSHHFRSAEEQYEELQALYEIGHRAETVRLLLSTRSADNETIRRELAIAENAAEKLSAHDTTMPGSIGDTGQSIRLQLQGAAQQWTNETDIEALHASVNRTLGHTVSLASQTKTEIVTNRALAMARFRRVIGTMAIVFGVTVLIAAFTGIRQYRSIMRPVLAIDSAVNQLGDARVGHHIEEHGDREFRRIMQHFNRSSSALAQLHASMRSQVEAKSRQLIRSEQLASVGCLAAGLAHEINNPLAIIAGHSEQMLRRLRSAPEHPNQSDVLKGVEQTLTTICEEAFRCRDITHDLLALAHPNEGDVEVVDVLSLVERAATLVRCLPIARDLEIVVRPEQPASELRCQGHASSLLQVLINLLTNAMEACSAGNGRVAVSLDRRFESIVIEVSDNGCGMTSNVLAHAFDPFFTEKPRRGMAGHGLGLSVSHAIIERHGGRLYAHSDGPGLGSTLSVELPIPATVCRVEEHA